MKPILSFRNVRTRFHLQRIVVRALDGVDLDVYENETLGIVGETGCGKSVLLLTALRLLPPNARVEGEILYDGRVNLLGVSEGEARKIIGREFALVPQGLGLALNPVLNVGFQICERAVEHRTYSKP
ncbi:MAG: dipeptide ABC transporter ATP-binding protein DppD, partial [Candidatus Wolframiiraptor sp.]